MLPGILVGRETLYQSQVRDACLFTVVSIVGMNHNHNELRDHRRNDQPLIDPRPLSHRELRGDLGPILYEIPDMTRLASTRAAASYPPQGNDMEKEGGVRVLDSTLYAA